MCDTEAVVCSCVYEFIEAGFGPRMPEPSAPKQRPLDLPRRVMGVGDVLILGDPWGDSGHEEWEIVHIISEHACYEHSEVNSQADLSDNHVHRFRRDDCPIRMLSPKLTGHYNIHALGDSLATEGLGHAHPSPEQKQNLR
ncbi:hypothetical protein [Nocardiopsis sp. JB363]|uniref:hypothetical protein n=1 Tax=Nocardiopsis sp. JB363 TaxID=1434837 RepID=UPI00097B701D|nr:hypothetical protein [Nocardiopsis sp. JB363]SIO86960.1 hypothetical protein BQ8420_14470 [Nocardiopsis sp. JB363]